MFEDFDKFGIINYKMMELARLTEVAVSASDSVLQVETSNILDLHNAEYATIDTF